MPDRQRLEQLLTRQENSIRRALAAFLATARSEHTMRPVREFLQQSNITAATDIVDGHIESLANIFPQTFVDAAAISVDHVAPSMLTKAKTPAPRVLVSFDPSNPRAAALMRASKLRFIQDFTDKQRAATRSALATSFARGTSVSTAARAFRNSIGLTQTQVAAVENYRSLLETGSADALSRGLRDRRFDRTLATALDDGSTLEPAQIDRMVQRYQEQMLAYRADTIARTEALRVVSEARQEAVQQVMDQTGTPDDQIERTWHATRDKRTRDTHAELDGQVVIGNETPFVSPSGEELLYPGDPSASAAETINCRCVVSVRILTPEEAQQAA